MPPKSNQPAYPKKPTAPVAPKPPFTKGKMPPKLPTVSLKDSMARRLQKK